ncbi:ROK family protein [Streptomyces sp. NPDC058289]|uniref:ROK family transcriptional regulator n=1 Tax=Streptomyces sp. NPDC058289 TaxID=3346425 RepID=UPI0036F137AC
MDVQAEDLPAWHARPSAPIPAPLRKVLTLVTCGEATSRADIARRTGLARSTVSQQVDHLIARGIVEETEANESVRGRPPRVLTISPRAGVIVSVDVDTDATRVAIADLCRRVIARAVVDTQVEDGPESVLAAVVERLRELLARPEIEHTTVRQVVVGLPAPVDYTRGCAVQPPIMPGWDGFPVGAYMHDALAAPVVVDNDVNLMALGEASLDDVETPLLFIKIAAGIGAGLVTADGDVHRGADGAAGDIGHIRAFHGEAVLCRCGKLGCLEAIASQRAVLNDLQIPESSEGNPLHGSQVLAQRVSAGDAQALRRIRQAATDLGDVVAMLVHVFNPRTLVLGGPLSELRDELLSGVRAVVYERALPLATRKLTITTSQLGTEAGTVGAIALGAKKVFSHHGLAHLLSET